MTENNRYDEKSYWDARYKRNLHSGEGSRGSELVFKINAIREVLSRYGSPTVLDFGHGDGELCFQLTKDISSYVGIDISEVAVTHCALEATKRGLDNFRFFLGDIASVDIQKADVVMCMDVLFHMPSQDKFDRAVDVLCRSFEKCAIISVWTEEMVRNVGGNFQKHNNYYKLTLPDGFKVATQLRVPNCVGKELMIITSQDA